MSKTPRLARLGASYKINLHFELIYKKFALPLTKFIVKKVGGDQETVEEVVSRTWAAAWKGWNTFENKSSYFTWICRIALNKLADYYRGQVHEQSLFIAPLLEEIAKIETKEPSAEEKLALHELRASIRSCIKLLPEEKRQLLYLRYWRQLTIKEIAKALGVSERSIEGRLYRARESLKKVFNLQYPDLEKVYNED